jgi:hypothetical protein
LNVPKKLPIVKNNIKETSPMRITPPVAITNHPRVREGELFAVITAPICHMLKVVFPFALQRNLEGIMPASRILEGESALPLFTEVRGKKEAFLELRRSKRLIGSSVKHSTTAW